LAGRSPLAPNVVLDLLKILDGVVFGFSELVQSLMDGRQKAIQFGERIDCLRHRFKDDVRRGLALRLCGHGHLTGERFGDFNVNGQDEFLAPAA
jgi:hypothetical protein